ncbi:innexin inx2-like isoform X2 [Anthonomus grandis grandis]|uniref:innexin inx2-like isoform X2 n=1 Tax=Anthonomus grandis grandis TaxID=2921223 RepID=UPI00216647D9|nr:innexin inx2-like isoform X2 [Anthonomus grandis grandis]
MQDFLNSFKNLIKSDDTRTDSNVFKLHYKFTVILLVVFSILLSSKQYFGDPISCDVNDKKETVDVFCWVSGTFIRPDTVTSQTLAAYKLAGLGNPVGTEIYTLFYYQWVCLLFCIQALMFYIPRYLWKSWEGNRLEIIVKDLRGPLSPDKWSADYKDKITNFMFCTRDHNAYALSYAFCELLSLGNLVLPSPCCVLILGGLIQHLKTITTVPA